jgi:hypothetical protein
MAKITLGQVSMHLAAICVGLGLVVPAVSAGQGLDVSMQQGRITIRAQQVSVKAILEEWGRVGHTAIVDADDLADEIVTLELIDVPEARTLRTLLRDAAGYLAAARTGRSNGDSQFDRILVMAETKAAAPRSASWLSGTGPAPPRLSQAAGVGSSSDGTRGRTPFTANAAQQEQLQQLLQRDGDDVKADAVAPAPAFGTTAPALVLPESNSEPSHAFGL